MSVSHTVTGGLVHPSGNTIEVVVTATEAKLKHKLALKVKCTDMLGVELPGSPYVEEIAPNNLVSKFDISALVDYPVQRTFDYPAVGVLNPQGAFTWKAILDIGEVWTDENGERQEEWAEITENNTLRIIKGKLRQDELNRLNDAGKSFASEYIEGGKFLTHQPITQKVAPHHIPRLWYLGRWTGTHDITVHVKAYFDSGTQETSQNFTLYDITGLVEFAFSPAHVGIYIISGDPVTKYEFWITDAGGEVSEHRFFEVDYTYYEKSFTVFADNPLSGIDLIWLTGEHTEGLTTQGETAYRPVPVGSGSKVSGVKTVSVTGQRTWEVNCGAKDRPEMLALRDPLESKEAWMVDPDNATKLIPILVERGDFTLYDSMQDIQNIAIKLTEAHL